VERVVNLIEGWLWIALGAVFLVTLFRPARRWMKLFAAVSFILFGLTDFVEMRTGAWWHPWWLLAWKGGCVAVMVGLLLTYRRGTDKSK